MPDCGTRGGGGRWTYWLASSVVYLTLIYSTGLHLAWGAEATVRAIFFNNRPRPDIAKHFPDYGSLHDNPLRVRRENGWKLTGFPCDQTRYLIQTEAFDEGIPPFKYRFLPTSLVGWLSDTTGIAVPRAFMMLNVVCIWLAALLFAAYLQRQFGFDDLFALLGGILLITMVTVTRTISYVMVEPASLLCMMVVVWCVVKRSIPGFLVAASLAVATKEVLAIGGLLWFVHHAQRQHLGRLVLDAAIAAWPLLLFVLIRIVLGGGITTHDGYDVLAGELPPFAGRILTLNGVVSLLERTLLAFGFMWLGLASIRRHPILARHSLIIPPVLLATYLLSLQITRIIGIIFPVVIPGFLLLLRQWLGPEECASAESGSQIAPRELDSPGGA